MYHAGGKHLLTPLNVAQDTCLEQAMDTSALLRCMIYKPACLYDFVPHGGSPYQAHVESKQLGAELLCRSEELAEIEQKG